MLNVNVNLKLKHSLIMQSLILCAFFAFIFLNAKTAKSFPKNAKKFNCYNNKLFSNNDSFYFGAIRRRNNPIAVKIRFGIQTAINGATDPLVAKVVEICMKRM